MKEASIISSLTELTHTMQQQWDCETFFSTFMHIFGTAKSSIDRALRNDRSINIASEEMGPQMMRADVAIPNRAYFRFLKNDEDVRDSIEVIKSSKEFNHPKAKLQFIVCVSPRQISVYDAVIDDTDSFPLSSLPEQYSIFLPLTGNFQRVKVKEGTEADVKACTRLTRLLDDLIRYNNIEDDRVHYVHEFVRRILFCLFAEDTGIFEQNQFTNAFALLTDKQGSNAADFFSDLFAVLNCPEDKRDRIGRPLAKELLAFPYVNGGLFAEQIFIPDFNLSTRDQLLNCGVLKWHEISPAIFGAMFQNALDPKLRREMGAHYTSEENILRVINPLFMDELNAEFERIKALPHQTTKAHQERRRQLIALQEKIASLKFLDPACGCGNFLIIAYRELRRLENRILDELFTDGFLLLADAIKVNINQFYGIEIEDWPAEIAHLSMWLMQHMMNQETAAKFGIAVPSIPLKSSATICCQNALTTDWNTVIKSEECDYIMGNPPFGGTTFTTAEQKAWLRDVYPPKAKVGLVDFVTAWFVKAADYMQGHKTIQTAFVATNSICQGVQVGILWDLLLNKGIKIQFAYRSFPWENAANNVATVTCVIVGFSYYDKSLKELFFIDKDKHLFEKLVVNISPYLIDSNSSVIVKSRNKAFNAPLNLRFGNKPIDGGNLILLPDEGNKLKEHNPEARSFLKFFIGSEGLINGTWRYCLWLKEEDKEQWSKIKPIMQHVEACRKFREKSTKTGDAFKWRDKPWSFREQINPSSAIVIPAVSSERRYYVPMDFINDQTIINNSCFILPDATTYEFGILTSRMHMCWMRLIGGRLETRYRYSRDLVYNTFIWPEVTEEQRSQISDLAKEVLLIREDHYPQCLAELYNPESMPSDLLKAHQELDRAVERLYRDKPFEDDDECTSFMLNLYAEAIANEETKA